MATGRIIVQLKARDMINKHAYVVDPKNDMEFRACTPGVMLDYLDPARVGYRPYNASKKTCKKCAVALGEMITEYGKNLTVVRSQAEHMDNARRSAARKVKTDE